MTRKPPPPKAGARFIRRARHQLARRYGRIMEITLGPRWDQEWIDEAACIVDDLAAAAGLTLEQWNARTDRAFRLFTDGRRRFDPRRWNDYVHAVALRLQRETIAALERSAR